MTLLDPGEYDDLPLEAKLQLAGIVRQPYRDHKDRVYGNRWGHYMNGELAYDPISRQIVGFGTGSPLAPHYTQAEIAAAQAAIIAGTPPTDGESEVTGG